MTQTNSETLTSTSSSFVPKKLTYEEFLREYEGQYAEYVGSEVLKPMSVTKKHKELTNFLSNLMQIFVEQKDLGQISGEPYQMKMEIDGETRGREPDIFFVRRENLGRIGEQFFEGGADLVIEIVSPESVVRDTQEKFEEYEKAGVEEYWIIDYNRRTANFYGFDENKKYKLLPISGDGKFESLVIKGLWIKPDWLWRETLPNLMDVLEEWGVVN